MFCPQMWNLTNCRTVLKSGRFQIVEVAKNYNSTSWESSFDVNKALVQIN